MKEEIEVKVTWRFAWALWWRWMVIGLAFSAVLYLPIFFILAALGIMAY